MIGYTISNGRTTGYIDVDAAKMWSDEIDNAILLDNGDFRAKKGKHIEIVEETGLGRIYNKNKLNIVNKQQGNKNKYNVYYGKDYINICRNIRKYALSDNIEIDTRPHRSNDGNNVHLFNLIKACGLELKEFVCGYLSVLQPYTLSAFQKSKQGNQVNARENIWVSDLGYRIAMVIKINVSDKEKPIIVSFHESNISSKYTSGVVHIPKDGKCAVIVDKVEDAGLGYSVEYSIQRGFIRYTIQSCTTQVNKDIALVDYNEIKSKLDNSMNNIFIKIRDTYLGRSNSNKVLVLGDDKDGSKLSFMSIGFASVNNICLMVDLYSQYTDASSRTVLVDMCFRMLSEIRIERIEEIRHALKTRYGSSNNGLYRSIMQM